MSAASAIPTPTTLPERAFSLHCQGLRSPDIAQVLGVPQRTVRYWIARVRDELVAAETAELRDEFLRAVEHFHQLSAAAWAAFEAEQEQAYPTLPDAPDGAIPTVGASGWTPSPSSAGRPSTPRHSPRYLRLALDAQRQVSRLLGHYDHPDRLRFLAPNLDPTDDLSRALPASPAAPTPEIAIPAKTATPASSEPPIPAKTATASVPQTRIPAESATRATLEPAFPAKTATHSAPPLRGSSCTSCSPWLNPRPLLPAQPAFPDSVPLHWRM